MKKNKVYSVKIVPKNTDAYSSMNYTITASSPLQAAMLSAQVEVGDAAIVTNMQNNKRYSFIKIKKPGKDNIITYKWKNISQSHHIELSFKK